MSLWGHYWKEDPKEFKGKKKSPLSALRFPNRFLETPSTISKSKAFAFAPKKSVYFQLCKSWVIKYMPSPRGKKVNWQNKTKQNQIIPTQGLCKSFDNYGKLPLRWRRKTMEWWEYAFLPACQCLTKSRDDRIFCLFGKW